MPDGGSIPPASTIHQGHRRVALFQVWSMAGYSGTPLAKKLGIKPGWAVHVVAAPGDYARLVAPLPPDVEVDARLSAATDLVHLFTSQKADLARRLKAYRTKLKPDAAIWVSWPKKSSKVPTDVTEDVVREVALPTGLVDTKVAAIDETWSGLRLVWRRERR